MILATSAVDVFSEIHMRKMILLTWIIFVLSPALYGYSDGATSFPSSQRRSCKDIGGYYLVNTCYWLTATLHNFKDGGTACSNISGHPFVNISDNTWPCIVDRLTDHSAGMGVYFGLQFFSGGIYTWDGVKVGSKNVYTSWMYQKAQGCAGVGSAGFEVFDCVTRKQMMCFSHNISARGTETITTMISEMVSELTIKKKTLSFDIRRKTSATDPRQTSTAIGFLGIIVITFVCAIVVFFDVMTFLQSV